MNEFRLDPESLSFTLVSKEPTKCKACDKKSEKLASFPFRKGYVNVYDIKDDVQPSKFELTGERFKSSNADGYEEITVENQEHGDNLRTYSTEEIEHLLWFLCERKRVLNKYNFGENMVIIRHLDQHGYFDTLLLHVPTQKVPGSRCTECENVNNTNDREVYKTENFVLYVPFAPKYGGEVIISPRKHLAFEDCDSVVLFDLAGVLKRLLEKQPQETTIAIVQMADRHFKVKLFHGAVDAYSVLGINRIDRSPEDISKELRAKMSNGT